MTWPLLVWRSYFRVIWYALRGYSMCRTYLERDE